jgi:hypothetical protein
VRFAVSCVCRVALASFAALMLTGCELLDSSLSPRTYSVNESSDAVLNNAVLLNIVRAGYSEPLNFISIAKYTAGDQLTGTGAVGPFSLAALSTHPSRTFGPASASGMLSNSFDLNAMETKDFYQGMLQTLDPIALELWFRQGLPRAVVFYVLLDSIRIKASDGVYEYKNDPTDDQWTEGNIKERTSPMCQPRLTGIGYQTNYDVDNTIWHGMHGEDCRFQKFAYLISLAVKYGLRLETITLPNQAPGKGPKPPPTAISPPNAVQGTTPNAAIASAPTAAAAPAAAATAPKTKTQICYDPAVLRAINESPALLPDFTICGQNKLSTKDNEINLGGIGRFKDTEFVMRSGFGIFQYLGRVLTTGSMETLTLGPRDFDVATRNDDHLLTVVQGGPNCFASAWYRSSWYCVPNDGAENTKLIFTMLRAIIATNISAALLNSTPTIRVTP